MLLASLSGPDRELLAAGAERSTFALGDILVKTGDSPGHAYFVESGIASIIKVDDAGRKTEVCILGPEGFFGGAVLFGGGVQTFDVYAQANPLVVILVPADDLRELVAHSRAAADLLSAAIYAQSLQIADNLVHAVWQPVVARLARWLTMYRERVAYDRLEITHAFMAMMVGAQRSKVTAALHELEAVGAINSSRGLVQIRDLDLLRAAARAGTGSICDQNRTTV